MLNGAEIDKVDWMICLRLPGNINDCFCVWTIFPFDEGQKGIRRKSKENLTFVKKKSDVRQKLKRRLLLKFENIEVPVLYEKAGTIKEEVNFLQAKTGLKGSHPFL